MGWREFFAGKRVTVMGLGLLGRGVGDTVFLAEHCAEVVVTDLKSAEELALSLARLQGFRNIRFVLGEHRYEDFVDRDFILKAAGVPLGSPYIAHAQAHGVPVEMSTALFAAFAPLPIIGVTGTRGKSTTAHLIAHTLTQAGARVLLGGNVVGVSTLALLPEAERYDVAVLELDSWQLQGFGARRLSPRIAVFTSFMEDHLNYYPSLAAYFADKAHIFAHQPKDEGVLVATPSVLHTIGRFGFARQVPKRVVLAQPTPEVPPTPHLLGEHNRWNAAAAYGVLRAWGLSEEAIAKGFASFPGVPGRLEPVARWRGITFYNDTTATTPQAAIAALRALLPRHPHLVAILGGADKGLPQERYEELAAFMQEHSVSIVLLPGSGTLRLAAALATVGVKDTPIAEHMAEAVSLALQRARDGAAIVLTPAFASFGLFRNEFDRGAQFVQAVRAATRYDRKEARQ